MSLPVLTPEEVIRRTGCISRSIPGIRTPGFGVPKKPPRSVTVDGRYWREEARVASPRSPQHLLSAVAEVVLPTPSTGSDRWYVLQNIVADLMLVFLSVVLVHVPLTVRELSPRHPWSPLQLLWHDVVGTDLGLILVYGALITLLNYSEGLFALPSALSNREQLVALCKSVAWATLLLEAAIRLSGGGTVSFGMLLGSAALNIGGMHGRRVWQRRRAARRAWSGEGIKNVLIVGAGRPGRELAEYLRKNPGAGRIVKGLIDTNCRADPGVLGPVEELGRIARAEFTDEIIVAVPDRPDVARQAIVEALRNHLDVRIVPDLFGYAPRNLTIEHMGALPVIPLHEEPIPQFGLLLKRALDILLSAVGLALAAPAIAVIAALVTMDSPGPVLYRAPRVGKKGQTFRCCKFRTMFADADQNKDQLRAHNERYGPTFKIVNDPRITRVGHFLRRYSLDELPQLWNVLRGEMSLVGPRPHPLDDYQRYELRHLRRLDVTPGITGLWQVTARRDPSFYTNIALDLEYIENWSLWMDLRILAKTFSVVLAGTGA